MNDKKRIVEPSSDKFIEELSKLHLAYQFDYGTHNSKKLDSSLCAAKRWDLREKTLLSPTVHNKHAERLAERFINRWNKHKLLKKKQWLKYSEVFKTSVPPTEHELASKHLRFFTLIDSVCAVDAREALKQAAIMKNDLIKVVDDTKGIWCLGAIEGEIVSMSRMRDIKERHKGLVYDSRKLDVCEILALDRDVPCTAESSLFLIHFHGILIANEEKQFEEFNEYLCTNKRWTVAPRQIEMKTLWRSYGGKPLTIKTNLTKIARYITKGGNSWCANKSYLRYKINIDNQDYQVIDEDTWVAINWRKKELLRQERIEDGLTDMLSLTRYEIGQLAIFVDGLMANHSTRAAYLICAGA